MAKNNKTRTAAHKKSEVKSVKKSSKKADAKKPAQPKKKDKKVLKKDEKAVKQKPSLKAKKQEKPLKNAPTKKDKPPSKKIKPVETKVKKPVQAETKTSAKSAKSNTSNKEPDKKNQPKSSKLNVSFEDTKPVSIKPRITHSRNGNLLYQVEYTIRSSPTILFDFLTTPSGLAQWFADSVDINEPYCSFVWEGYEDQATIIDAMEDEYVRYRWDHSGEDEFFEFRITKNDITGDTILVITDFAPPEDVKDQKLLWDSQVKKLIQQIGG